MKVIEPGFLTTVQDKGRFHYQKWGVPVAGAMDGYALQAANFLVGNDGDEGCLEITLLGPAIEFLASGLVALAGADLGAELNGDACDPWKSFRVKKGDKLNFSGVRNGCRAYLAVAGGFRTPFIMGSMSTYLRGKIGGVEGRAVQKGDVLDVNPTEESTATTEVPSEYRNELEESVTVRVVLGPQEDAFTEKGKTTFLENRYTVTHESDRMGCRLEGPVIEHTDKPDIVSDGIAMGSVQVPGNGKPIIMMADRQTVGGYAKIATVITPDLWKVAQAKPGDSIGFTGISLEAAQGEYKKYKEKIISLSDNLKEMQKVQCDFKANKRVLHVKINGEEFRVEMEEL
ncbi:MAG TPA: biotin-dependent carboxyltransferase family protein [Clostridia bacterium]|nr:biotin-dependent carboxyltransferase family protein [Clostridia bacterium]